MPGETPELKARVAAEVVALRRLEPTTTPSFPEQNAAGETVYARGEADIEFPLEAVGTDLAALTTIAIGGVYSIKGFSGIRIVDMSLPPEFAGAHPGPQFGVAGSRTLTGVQERPIIGSIVKPALGLRPNETAELVRELVEADVDFIKDDEKLMSPAYSPPGGPGEGDHADHPRSRAEDRQEGDVRVRHLARRSRDDGPQPRLGR